VDRVIAAEQRAHPPLFAVESVPEAPSGRGGFWRLPWQAVAAVASVAVAVGIGVGLSVAPGIADRERARSVAIGEGEAEHASTSLPLRKLGLRPDGNPGMPLPEDMARKIDRYIASYGENWGPTFQFHGAVLIARDGEVKYNRGFGVADPATGLPNGPGTRFRLGLLTEQFTAAAIMQLRDEGLLELDDAVSNYLPEFPPGNLITLEQLLDHTSGLPNYTDFPYFEVWKAEHHTTDDMLRRLGAFELEFDPGSQFEPTNSGYYVLGAIIERITGSSYGDYVTEHVLRPAGMAQSTFGDAYETGEQALGNVWNDEEVLDPPDAIDMSVFGAAGGLVSTPLDLLRWDIALHQGTVLAPASVQEMMTPNEAGYGYGWIVGRGYGQPVVSFPGAIDGFNGSMLRFTRDRTLIVVLCNTEVVPGSQIAQDLAMLVYGESPVARREYREVKIPPGIYPRYVGRYGVTAETRQQYASLVDPQRFSLLESVFVRQFGDRLYFDVPNHGLTWMHPMGHNRFFFKDHTGNTMSFEIEGDDEQASVMRLHYDNAVLELARR
jgi:CubicO group peptidase (beta-lactamase class C family)